ncbi:MAG: diguanylate cyclase [Flavobacteriales bacterium]|jgi:diguanylate cyclase
MANSESFLKDFHWMMDVLQSIDVGLVILNEDFDIQLWNSFMQNHSARQPNEVLGANLFNLFPELPESWFRRKAQSVFTLHNSAFTTWEQRPYLFRFQSYRPITSIAEFMYQNSTIIPLKTTSGHVEHICLIIYDVTEVAVNRTQIQAANAQLQLLSRTDGLTGLLNRKTWETELNREFKMCLRHGQNSSMIMFDIDHFKKVNDGYGHPAGDEVIRRTATIAQECIRDIDIAGRYGGEEFAIILSNTDAEAALVVAERIRKKIESSPAIYEGNSISYTISLGISNVYSFFSEPTHWIDSADKGLYQAKRAGRNNSVIHTPVAAAR